MYPSQDTAEALYGKVGIDLVFTAGTSGAVPSALTYSTGITSVTKSTTTYVVLFDQAYLAYINGFGSVVQASYSAGGALILQPVAVSIDDSTPTVTLQAYDAAGTAVALAEGDVLRFTFYVASKPQPNAT